jgi:hypothetical protein
MSSKDYSAILQGLNPTIIEVEVDQTDGLPVLVLIGLATSAVIEAKERITTSLQSCGLKLKTKLTFVNRAPTDIKKSSPALDLAILAALLKQNGLIKRDLSKYLFLGEVGLDGRIKSVHGALPIVLQAHANGFETVFLPSANLAGLTLVKNCQLVACDHLQQLVKLLRSTGELPYAQLTATTAKLLQPPLSINTIIGQPKAKRAIEQGYALPSPAGPRAPDGSEGAASTPAEEARITPSRGRARPRWPGSSCITIGATAMDCTQYVPEHHAYRDGSDDLDVEDRIERLATLGRRQARGFV